MFVHVRTHVLVHVFHAYILDVGHTIADRSDGGVHIYCSMSEPTSALCLMVNSVLCNLHTLVHVNTQLT